MLNMITLLHDIPYDFQCIRYHPKNPFQTYILIDICNPVLKTTRDSLAKVCNKLMI